jgi:hypothetical protein
MSSEPTPTRRPIGTVRVSTVALLAVVTAVAVPAGAAALVMSGALDDKQTQQNITQAGPVTKVVVSDSDGSVHITGDPTLLGVTGKATLSWHAYRGHNPVSVSQKYADGVLTLTKVCNGACGGADIEIKVPVNASVQVNTSNAGIDVTNVTGTVDLVDENAGISAKGLGSGDATMNTTNAEINASFAGAPKNIGAFTSNATVSIRTDGVTDYYDSVTTSNGAPDLQNKQDRWSKNTITVNTSNADVTIK